MQATPSNKGKEEDYAGKMTKDQGSRTEALLTRKQSSDNSFQVGTWGSNVRELTRYSGAKHCISILFWYVYWWSLIADSITIFLLHFFLTPVGDYEAIEPPLSAEVPKALVCSIWNVKVYWTWEEPPSQHPSPGRVPFPPLDFVQVALIIIYGTMDQNGAIMVLVHLTMLNWFSNKIEFKLAYESFSFGCSNLEPEETEPLSGSEVRWAVRGCFPIIWKKSVCSQIIEIQISSW